MNRGVAKVCLGVLLAAVPASARAQQRTPSADTLMARVLTLPEAMALAVDGNRDLRIAELELEKAEDQVDEAWGKTLPTVDASANYTHNFKVSPVFIPGAIVGQPDKDLVPVTFGAKHSWQATIDATQPLFDPAIFVGVGAAGRYKALQTEVVRGTRDQVATAARIAFYDALLAQESARLNRESLTRVQQTLDETKAMYQAGLTSEFESLRLQVELSNVQSDLRRAENAADAALRTLAVQLGLDPSAPLEVAGSLASLELEPAANEEPANREVLETAGVVDPTQRSPEELFEMARRGRSDLRQLRLTRELRQTEVRLEKWSYLPKVSLFGNYTVAAQQQEFHFFGEQGSRGFGQVAGVRVTLPVFSGFQRWNRIEQKQAVVDEVDAQIDQAVDRTESQVTTLYEQVQEARQRADAQRESVAQAQRGYDIASAEYREGLGSRLQVTDAEVSLRRAEFNYAQAVYDWLVARARLDEAVGMVPLTGDDDATDR